MADTLVTPTATSIKLRFPEFADVSDTEIEFAIEDAMLVLGDGTNWTNGLNVAAAYLCAHFVAAGIARTSGGESGDIASESIGRLSVSYAQQTTAVAEDRDSTSYGRRYLELVNANFSGARIV